MPTLELAAGAARVLLLPATGGAIGTFTVDGETVLRPMPDDADATADVKSTACYPLVPYSNRIRNAELTFAGVRYALARNFGDHPHAIHGVGWQRAWNVAGASRSRARLMLVHDAVGATKSAWPWPFRATQTFDLAAQGVRATLTATMTIENTGDAPFPFGLGWHPFFPRDTTTTLEFAARSVWRNDATQLPVERLDAMGGWSFAPARDPGGTTLDNVFAGWGGRATLRSTRTGRATTIEADSACGCLVVFAPTCGDFVAVEPVTHETDAFNRAAAGAPATGMRVLPAGAAFSCTMRIASAPLV
jgi:aldose 1-epimerase